MVTCWLWSISSFVSWLVLGGLCSLWMVVRKILFDWRRGRCLSCCSELTPVATVVATGNFHFIRTVRKNLHTTSKRAFSITREFHPDRRPGCNSGWLFVLYRCLCMAVCSANLSPIWLSTCGSSSLVWVGKSVRVLLPIRRWAGEVPRPYGVFLQSKSVSRALLDSIPHLPQLPRVACFLSLLSAHAFLSSALQTLTLFSAFPFD